MDLFFYERTIVSFSMWGSIIALATLTTVLITFTHLKLRDGEEILRIRPKIFAQAASTAVLFSLLVTGVKSLSYIAPIDVIYSMCMFMCTSFFYLFFIDTSYFLLRSAEYHPEKRKWHNVLVTKKKYFRKYTIIALYLSIILNVAEKIVTHYLEFPFLNVVFGLNYLGFCAFFVVQMLNVNDQNEDSVGLKTQITYLGLVIVLFPVTHIVSNAQAYLQTSLGVVIGIMGFYQEIALMHIVALIQVGYPLVLMFYDVSFFGNVEMTKSTNTEMKAEKLKFEELMSDKLYTEYFGMYLKTEFSYLHMEFWQDATVVMDLIHTKIDSKDTSEDIMLEITDKMVELIDKYIQSEEVISSLSINAMFEGETGELESINLEKKLKAQLRDLKDKLEKPSMFELLDPTLNTELTKQIKETLQNSMKKVIRMLRNSSIRFKRHTLHVEYMEKLREEF